MGILGFSGCFGGTLIQKTTKGEWSIADHQNGRGKHFSSRYQGLADDVRRASQSGHWQYFRSHNAQIGTVARVEDEAGRTFEGLNGASQDYLGLSSDGRIIEAVKRSVSELGVHSAGSAPMGGGTRLGRECAQGISSAMGKQHVILFPTGWAAGYGSIYGLVRAWDHVIIDALAHNCLQHGANAATKNVYRFIHNDVDSLEKRLARVRAADPEGAILIVTESLFSMDSDAPEMARIVALRRKYDAQLLLDVAHDLGALGPGGKGLCSEFYQDVDFIMGSFSKTFASTGGFVATSDEACARAIQGYSGSYTFSNFLIPAQLAAVCAAMTVVFSGEGDLLREQLLKNTIALRRLLSDAGLSVMGIPSAMVIVEIGAESTAREAYRQLLEKKVIVNCIEYPAVRKGRSRFRIQLSPKHTMAQVNQIAEGVIGVLRNFS